MIVTLKERKMRALKARREALLRVRPRLIEEAARHGGRYRIFGSAARAEIHADSDIDLLADFSRDTIVAAISAAEEACRSYGLPCDIVDQQCCDADFLQSVLPDSVVLE